MFSSSKLQLENSKLIGYADDLGLFITGSDSEAMVAQINTIIKQIHAYLKRHDNDDKVLHPQEYKIID